MFKKEYLYELIEGIYSNDTNRNLAVTKLIKRLDSSSNEEMAGIIRNIQQQNTSAVKSTARISKNNVFSDYDEKLQGEIKLLQAGYKHNIINSAILFGRPGTGKTAFVSKLGKEMKLQVVRLNLSNVLDYRYGESIKKLENFITLNKDKKQIIFFDEADSLFTKRGQKNDVFETSRLITTMLQLLDMERKALVIISTNLIGTIDKAILRRFDLMMSFDHAIKNTEKVLKYNLSLMNINVTKKETDDLFNMFDKAEFVPTFSDLNIVAKRIAIAKLEQIGKITYKKIIAATIEDLKLAKTTEWKVR